MDTKKQMFLMECANVATMQAQLFIRWTQISSVFFDRAYNNTVVLSDDDLAQLGLTRANLNSLITLAQQMDALRQGNTIATGDYESVVNTWRTDV